MTEMPGQQPLLTCGYCLRGTREMCICTEDCGARAGEFTGHDCPQRPCQCYSCDGQCGGTQQPGSCGRPENVAGVMICAACREQADIFTSDDTGREGFKVTTDGHQVTVKAPVFGTSHWYNLTPAMARAFGMRLLELGWEAQMAEADGYVAELLSDMRAFIDSEVRAAEKPQS
jgi:hypothetical protein